MYVSPMANGFGAHVRDVGPLADCGADDIAHLMRALYRHRFLVLDNQELDQPAYADFAKRWGDPILFFDPRLRDRQFPELIVIDNRADTPSERRNSALHWHVDGSYEDPPASTTMLYAVEAPAKGNETLFCDMVAAHAALEPATKLRIADLVCIHGVGDERLLLDGEHRGRGDVATRSTVVTHPLVRPHPVTGEAVLYAPSGSARGIVGMADDEALALLILLKRHATNPRFVAKAAARTRGLLIWDNYSVMHSATPTRYSDADGERRLIYRISTRDIPAPSILDDSERSTAAAL